MILHDDSGGFVSCHSLVIPGVYRVDEEEVMGLLKALSWIKQLGFHRVKIEMDAELVVDVMNYEVNQVNEMAHRITRAARTFPSPYC
ncbi:hypothetical protein ACS0TY_015048 [Phlomoides rotata]